MAKQPPNSGQQNRALRLRLLGAVKDKRFNWTLRFLYVGLQGILLCGAVEAAPTIPSDVRPEREDCSQVAVVVLKNDCGRNLMTGAEAKQGIGERGAKCGAGDSDSAKPVISPDKMGAKGGNKQTAGNSDSVLRDKFYEFVQGALFAILIAWPIIFLGNAGPWGGLPNPFEKQSNVGGQAQPKAVASGPTC